MKILTGMAVLMTVLGSLAVAADNDALRVQGRIQIEDLMWRYARVHMVTNHSIEFVDKDHARVNAYYITVSAAGGANVPARVAAAGREVDELVRLNGQWLIKVRDVAPKD